MEGSAIMEPDEEEIAAGFSAQTFSYPDRYELPRLGSDKKSRMERVIGLELDEHNRIKRCKARDGYVHELLVDGEWSEHQKFMSLSEVLTWEIYSSFRRKEGQKNLDMEEHD